MPSNAFAATFQPRKMSMFRSFPTTNVRSIWLLRGEPVPSRNRTMTTSRLWSTRIGATHRQPIIGVQHGPRAMTRRYQPIKLHARGGLGEVYLAKDMELGRVVALKRIRSDLESKPRQQERFVFEAEVTGSLEHPGIVPIYSLSKDDASLPSYAMRFIRGQSFSDAIKGFHQANPNPTSATFVGREFRQLLRRLIDSCNAMQYAHQRGILHRDLKPDNIMLGRYGETLVVDWGLAQTSRRCAQEAVAIGSRRPTDLFNARLADASRFGRGDAGLHEPRASVRSYTTS